jgi:PAS domain S-box-containing protein
MKPPDTTDPPPESKRLCEIVLNLVDHLDAMVAYWDINQTCIFANDAYRSWFGKSGEEVVGLTMQQLLGPLYAKNLPYIRAAYDGHRQVFEREIPTPGGDVRSSLATYTPDWVDGRVLGIFVHVADVTPLKKLERELNAAKDKAEYLATHDFSPECRTGFCSWTGSRRHCRLPRVVSTRWRFSVLISTISR